MKIDNGSIDLSKIYIRSDSNRILSTANVVINNNNSIDNIIIHLDNTPVIRKVPVIISDNAIDITRAIDLESKKTLSTSRDITFNINDNYVIPANPGDFVVVSGSKYILKKICHVNEYGSDYIRIRLKTLW